MYKSQKAWKVRNPEAVKSQQKKDNYKLSYDLRGRLTATYAGIRSRCLGKGTRGDRIYKGLAFCERGPFLVWATADERYSKLFYIWKEKGFPRKLAPSIDRIDNKRGYELDNLQWLTREDNGRKAAIGYHHEC